MSDIVALGQQLLAEQQSQADAELYAQALAELALTAPAVLDLLNSVLSRLASAEAEIMATKQAVIATRIRRPIRDELGTILYVIDEMQPPVWAQPMTAVPAGSPTGM